MPQRGGLREKSDYQEARSSDAPGLRGTTKEDKPFSWLEDRWDPNRRAVGAWTLLPRRLEEYLLLKHEGRQTGFLWSP